MSRKLASSALLSVSIATVGSLLGHGQPLALAGTPPGVVLLQLPPDVTIQTNKNETISGVRLTAVSSGGITYEKGGKRFLPALETKRVSFRGDLLIRGRRKIQLLSFEAKQKIDRVNMPALKKREATQDAMGSGSLQPDKSINDAMDFEERRVDKLSRNTLRPSVMHTAGESIILELLNCPLRIDEVLVVPAALAIQPNGSSLTLIPTRLPKMMSMDLQATSRTHTLIAHEMRIDPSGMVRLGYKACAPKG